MKITTTLFFFLKFKFFFSQTVKNDTIKVATRATISKVTITNYTVKVAATPGVLNPKLTVAAKSLNSQLKWEEQTIKEARKSKRVKRM